MTFRSLSLAATCLQGGIIEKYKHKKNKRRLLLLNLHTVPFNAERQRQAGKSCEYQCLSHWFNPTQNQTQSFKFTATETGALSTSPSEQLNPMKNYLMKTILVFCTHHNMYTSFKNSNANFSSQG